jgi:methionyl-tRNA synthetase
MSMPWKKVVTFGPGEPGEDVDKIIFETTEALRITGILLQPWMPNKANLLLDQLGVRPDRRTFAWCKPGADLEYGEPMVDLDSKQPNLLFPPLTSND